MYTRVVRANIKPEKLKEFKQTLTNELLPAIRSQKGFVDAVEMYSGSQLVCTTFWKTKEDVERYSAGLGAQIIDAAKPFVTNTEAGIYEVENSTVHKIGQAA